MRFLDASVSGGMPGAEAGTLAIMASGSLHDFTEAAPVYSALGRAQVVGQAGRQAACRLRSYAINDCGRDDQHRGLGLVAGTGCGRRSCGRTRGDPGRLRREPLARGPWAAHAGPKSRATRAGQEPTKGFAQRAGRSGGSRAGADTDGSASAQLRVNLRGVGRRGSFRRLVGNTCCRASRPSCE